MQRPNALKFHNAILYSTLALLPLHSPAQSTAQSTASNPSQTAPAAPTSEQQTERARFAAQMAQQNAATEADYADMKRQLGITSLRPGASGTPGQPNSANYDDARVPAYTLPDPLLLPNGKHVSSARTWWTVRRPELVHLLEDDMYGHIPTHTPGVTWTVTSTTDETLNGVEAITRKLRGHVDNSSDPAITVDIDADLTLPAHAKGPVPVIIAFDWPPEFWAEMARRTGHSIPAPTGPTARELAIAHGWGYAMLVPTSIQADNGAGLTSGIIGLCNHGAHRTPDQWGALRAWGWGAGKLLDYFATLPEVDIHHVGIFGHSRYGKAALVTMAFDQRFWIGYISSSGEGGAKLNRRQYGELLENVAASGEYHWMAGNFLRYAGPQTANDLPVDAHDLIALCAPRPVFLSAGTQQAGDGWADAKGSFLAAAAASPVYKLLGTQGLGTDVFPPVQTEVGNGPLVFRQHTQGHTPMPNWSYFLDFANRELKTTPSHTTG